MGMTRWQAAAAGWLAAAGLVGCGGGGGGASGGGQLSGSVTLQASAEVATPASISATLPADASGQPSCVLVTGQLPPGMTLSACTLQGTPTQIGVFASQLTLTIPGYTGSTRVDASIGIGGPLLGPSPVPQGTGLPVGSPVTSLSLVGLSFVPPFALRPTDGVSYRVSAGVVPPGLSFDTSSGMLSGTPTQAGAYPLTVGATLNRGGVVYAMADYVTNGVVVVGR